MAASPDGVSSFTSRRGAERFRRAYDTAMADLWPTNPQTRDIETRFGTVRTYRVGSPGSPRVVLLCGAGGSSVSWYQYASLGDHFDVLAVDTLGDPGRSVQAVPIANATDTADWLEETFVALNVTDAHVVGTSYGGWIAVQHALRQPGRTTRITLVDGAGFEPVDRRFYGWVILGGLATLMPARLRRRAATRLVNGTLSNDELIRLGRASTAFRRRLPPAELFTDDQLDALTVPTQLLLGERSTMHNAARVTDRARQHIPHLRVETVPDTGHALQVEQPDLVADRIESFTAAD